MPYFDENIDKFLMSPENINELIDYLTNNPKSMQYINHLIYQFAINSTHPSSTDLKKIEMLFKAGANPNYINDTSSTPESILQAAAFNEHPELIELLINYGADVAMYIPKKPLPREDLKELYNLTDEELDHRYQQDELRIKNMSATDKIQEMIKLGKLPLQRAIKNRCYHSSSNNEEAKKTCEILSDRTISVLNLDNSILDAFTKMYAELDEQINNAYIVSRKNNKQLIITIGENHESMSALAVELMIMLIAKKYGINTLLTEHNKYMNHCIKTQNMVPTRPNEWTTSLTVHQQGKQLGIDMIPVDLGHWGAKKISDKFDDYENLTAQQPNFNDHSPEGFRYRNQVMHDVITSGIKQNSILIIGSAHIYGLIEEIPFPETIQTLVINADISMSKTALKENNLNVVKEINYALNSPSILKPTSDIEKFTPLLSPESTVDYVMKANKQFQLNNSLPSNAENSILFSNKVNIDKTNLPSTKTMKK